MHYISDILYWIATGLLVPVILLLILLFLRSLLLLGGFFGQYISVRKTHNFLQKEISQLNGENLSEFEEHLNQEHHSPFIQALQDVLKAKRSRARINHLIDEYERYANQELDASRLLLKMGPMLGLMGTLIPMGPALVGLSTGDIASMAYNMQVAFATTVVGLAASAIGFITKQVKQNWYAKEMNDLEYLSQLIEERYEKK